MKLDVVAIASIVVGGLISAVVVYQLKARTKGIIDDD